MPTKTIQIKADTLYRSALVDRSGIDEETRTVEVAFSSEQPYERVWGIEVLDHSAKSIRLDRLKDGGPLLMDHDHKDHVGVVESVSIDPDRRGRAKVRFGKSARANEVFQDVIDGIRKHISVGYWIHTDPTLEKEVKGGPNVYRVNDWEPLEVSFVSVPADASVGVARSSDNENTHTPSKDGFFMPEEKPWDTKYTRRNIY